MSDLVVAQPGRAIATAVDGPAAIAAGSGLLAVSGFVYNTLPIVLGAAADSLGLTHQQIGYLGSAYLLGFAGTPVTGPLWTRRANWRRVQTVALVVIALSCAASTVYLKFVPLLIGVTFAGIGAGIAFSLAIVSLGDATHNERAFIVGETSGLLVAAIGVWTLPVFVIPRYGITGVLWSIAAMAAMMLFTVPWFPRSNMKRDRRKRATSGAVGCVTVFVGLTGLGFYYIGLAGLWSFLERIGKDGGLDAQWVGRAFSLEKVLVLSTCVLVFWQGKRLGHVLPLLIGCAGMLVAAVLLSSGAGAYAYLAGVSVFGVAWTYCFPFQLAVITQSDHDGRYASLIPAFMGAGSTLGPSAAGLVMNETSYTTVYEFTTVCCVIGTALLVIAARQVQSSGVRTKLEQ